MMPRRILHLGAVLAALAGPVALTALVAPAQAQSQAQQLLAGRSLIHLQRDERDLALEAIRQALEIHPFLGERGLFPELNAIPI